MSTSLGDFRTIVKRRLAEHDPIEEGLTPTWDPAQLDQWIADAIADYSLHFPRTQVAVVSITSSQARIHDLGDYGGLRAVVEVQYPWDSSTENDDPYSALVYRAPGDPRGFDGQRVYYVEGSPPDRLYIGPTPAEGERIRLLYHADHLYPESDDDVLTVPEAHLESLLLYIRWAAHQELEMRHLKNPDLSTTALTVFSQAVARAQDAYTRYLERLRRAAPRRGPESIQWELPDRWAGNSWS
jgi:hypothetical protein